MKKLNTHMKSVLSENGSAGLVPPIIAPNARVVSIDWATKLSPDGGYVYTYKIKCATDKGKDKKEKVEEQEEEKPAALVKKASSMIRIPGSEFAPNFTRKLEKLEISTTCAFVSVHSAITATPKCTECAFLRQCTEFYAKNRKTRIFALFLRNLRILSWMCSQKTRQIQICQKKHVFKLKMSEKIFRNPLRRSVSPCRRRIRHFSVRMWPFDLQRVPPEFAEHRLFRRLSRVL